MMTSNSLASSAAATTALALSFVSKHGDRRWLLELFQSIDPPAIVRRHAVWLAQDGQSWRWWCSCGCPPSQSEDVAVSLTTARLHFYEVALSARVSPVDHPIAVWRRVVGSPAQDDVAVAELAKAISP